MSPQDKIKQFHEKGIVSWYQVYHRFGVPDTESMIGTFQESVEARGGPNTLLRDLVDKIRLNVSRGLPGETSLLVDELKYFVDKYFAA